MVVLAEFQTTYLSSYSNPLKFRVIMPNYFAVNLISHIQLLQPAFTMVNVILPFQGHIQDFYNGVSISKKLQEYKIIWN